MTQSAVPILADSIHVSYRVDGRNILDKSSFELERGETLVLLGRSGSGKTTALRLINRMLQPTAGTIRMDGKDVAAIDPIACGAGSAT